VQRVNEDIRSSICEKRANENRLSNFESIRFRFHALDVAFINITTT
jgi:hypothetical protein